MNRRVEPVRVATNSADEDGRLVFLEDCLVAVLVRLSDQHGSEAGKWFVEVAFGAVPGQNAPIFSDLGEAEEWIAQHWGADAASE